MRCGFRVVRLFLSLTLLSHEGGASCCLHGRIATKKTWGCKNQNSRLELSTDVSNISIWGKERSIIPLEYKDLLVLELHLTKIRDILRDLIADVKVNNVDYFLEFQHNARSANHTSFINFFKSYRPKILMSYESLSAELFRRIEQELRSTIPNLKNSMFLCAGVEDVPKKLVRNLNKPNNGSSEIPANYFDQVLGAIKFVYRPVNKNASSIFRTLHRSDVKEEGIILMNPGDAVPDPIVIMKDNQDSYGEFGPVVREQNIIYSYLPENKDYILARSVGKVTDWLGNTDLVELLIYAAKPYCSVRDTTSKYDLLSPEKMERKSYPSGLTQAAYYFAILPKHEEIAPYPMDIGRPYFDLFLYDEKKNRVWRYRTSFQALKHSKFQALKQNTTKQFDDELVATFVKISQLLGYSRNGLLKKLENYDYFLNDNKFLQDVWSVYTNIQKFKNTV